MKLRSWRKHEQRSQELSLDGYIDLLNQFGGRGVTTLPGAKQEPIGDDFAGLAHAAFKSDGVVFACMLVRMLVFSEARFKWRRLGSGSPGGIFGDQQLQALERPWPGGRTPDLLKRALIYSDLGGNAYFARRPGNRVMPLRPDWVEIVIGSQDSDAGAWDLDSEVLGYIYTPGGKNSGREAIPFLADEVAHFAPIPDPEAQFRGMSWLTPIIREVQADKAATQHKLAFWENAATVNMAVKIDTDDLEKYTQWIARFREQHEGRLNAYKTLFLGAGADLTPVGANLEQSAFKDVTGAGETRIAAASGTPPVLVGLSEGLASATYSNYGMARRRFADGTIRPLWRDICGSLESIVQVPTGCELWYDESDIAFLREDQKDAAEILSLNSVAIKQLVDAGYDAATVIDAVNSGNLGKLVHTGLFSVQLQPPGANAPAETLAPVRSLELTRPKEEVQP